MKTNAFVPLCDVKGGGNTERTLSGANKVTECIGEKEKRSFCQYIFSSSVLNVYCPGYLRLELCIDFFRTDDRLEAKHTFGCFGTAETISPAQQRTKSQLCVALLLIFAHMSVISYRALTYGECTC